jgi:hypothetical protein
MWGQRHEGVFLWIMGGRTHLFGIFRKLHRNLCSLGSFGRIFHNRNTAKINPEGVTIRRLCGSLFRVPEAPAVAENSAGSRGESFAQSAQPTSAPRYPCGETIPQPTKESVSLRNRQQPDSQACPAWPLASSLADRIDGHVWFHMPLAPGWKGNAPRPAPAGRPPALLPSRRICPLADAASATRPSAAPQREKSR